MKQLAQGLMETCRHKLRLQGRWKSQLRARRSAHAGAFRSQGNKAPLARRLMRRDGRPVCRSPSTLFFLEQSDYFVSLTQLTQLTLQPNKTSRSRNLRAPRHHVFPSSRNWRTGQERAYPVPILLRMVSGLEIAQAKSLMQAARTSSFPAKTSLRTSYCSRVAPVLSPKKHLHPASCATTSRRQSEPQLV
jgi:hypothetical protein